jgi:acyl dehydratase
MDKVQVGYALPSITRGPITRTTLALFAGASGDPNPIHIDLDFARAAGLDDVFAHGMLSMAYLGQLLTGWRAQAELREWNARFQVITPVGATVTCSGEVIEIFDMDGERRARVRIVAVIDGDATTLAGEAVVAIG